MILISPTADLEATWHLIGQAIDRDGEKYMQIKRFIPTYRVGGMKSSAENLVDGAPELSEYALALADVLGLLRLNSFRLYSLELKHKSAMLKTASTPVMHENSVKV